ncbi:TolC family outer membrane protein [Paraburkholderia saeva]|jgi:outer membrane protein|uniref:TolC family outer membrane protein n=1 Tax=Paraburkholderia saeva TaxID=2777537 RepID=UPI001DF4344D|nr:TolC family outer membrane protein [Paraburkholderia saeva]CAG4920899.1 Outer membrane protein TolC [Paraburkholderia saeva]CAG4926961.1 Outer membrane protein TolC [Paraburkholderia saeva]
MNKRKVLVALMIVAGARCAHAADLLTVVEQTADHDAELAASRAGARAAHQAVPKARAQLLPRVEGGWGRAYNRIATEDFPTTSYWQNGWTVSLTQPVFDWSRWTTYRQADFVEARGATEVARAQQASILKAARAYFDELAAEDELARANDYAAALDTHLAQLHRRQQAGDATVIDLREAESGVLQAHLQQQDAENTLQLSRLALEQMTGQPFAALSRLADSVAMPRVEPDDIDAWANQAQAHDYQVQLKQIDWRIAKLEVEKARAAHLPTVNITASHTPAGAGSGYSRPTTTTTAMLSVSIPFFEGGETEARVDETVALEDKAQDELTLAVRQAGASARENWTRLRSGAARVEALVRLVRTSNAALAATQIGYKVGSRESTDVLRAADTFYASRRDLIRARYETVLALLQLKAATAALTFDEVASVNALLVSAASGAPPQQPLRTPQVAPARP